LAFSHHNVGLSLVAAGDLASALAHFKQELSRFESLSAADRRDVQARRNRSLAHKQIGDVLMRTADVRGALAQYRAALVIDRDLTSVDPGNSQALLDLSFSESKVGSALGKLGQTREALVMLRGAVARQESLIAKDPHHILLYNHLANSYTLLASCLLDSADTKSAIEYYRKAVAARLTLSEKSPNSGANRGALAECYTNLAKALGTSDRETALKQYSNAVELLEHLTAVDRGNVQYRIVLADTLFNTARLYVRMAVQDREPSTRLRYWTNAGSFYQRSQELWLELGRAGKLPPARGREIREVSGELARCNDAVAKLRQVQ
jgi:tetratricopeptide (TPR) repeat protein